MSADTFSFVSTQAQRCAANAAKHLLETAVCALQALGTNVKPCMHVLAGCKSCRACAARMCKHGLQVGAGIAALGAHLSRFQVGSLQREAVIIQRAQHVHGLRVEVGLSRPCTR